MVFFAYGETKIGNIKGKSPAPENVSVGKYQRREIADKVMISSQESGKRQGEAKTRYRLFAWHEHCSLRSGETKKAQIDVRRDRAYISLT